VSTDRSGTVKVHVNSAGVASTQMLQVTIG